MTDIVQKLRTYRPRYGWPEEYSTVVEPTMNHVAADEIERLREALQQGVTMRAAQKAYFADRSRENLIASKEAEKAFDAALARAALGEFKS